MRAKTKKNWFSIITAILAVVFAFTIGVTYAAQIVNLSFGSNGYDTTAYAGKQSYVVINDTEKTPIPFGTGARNYEVAIQYSFSYSFDIRVRYSLAWSSGADTSNVILNYANRNNFIVDNEYIYYTETIPAGTGTLNIFTGVSFTDTTDSTYEGASLTINIDEVKIRKSTSSYTTSHDLYVDSVAGNAWIQYKNRSTLSGAHVIVYNSRYDYDHGVSHPGAESAYQKNMTGSVVTSANWAGGNKEYAGVGMYIINGSSAITLRVNVVGSWRPTDSATILDNTILLNYSSNWTRERMSTDNVFGIYTYNLIIPANTALYINILDSVEIISKGLLQQADYTNHRMLITRITVNDVAFYSFTDGISTGNIVNTTDVTTTGTYNPTSDSNKVSVINTTLYQPGLYDISLEGQQTYDANVSITNNTANKIRVSVTFSLRYYISNAKTSISGDQVYGDASDFDDPTLWFRDTGTTSSATDFSANAINLTSYIAPYSTVNILQQYVVNAAFRSSMISQYGNFDFWVVLEPTISILDDNDTSTTTALSVETSAVSSGSNTILTFSVKNNSMEAMTGINAELIAYRNVASFASTSAQPDDWVSSYWRYYYYDTGTGTYVQNTNRTWNDEQQYYTMTQSRELISLTNATLYNGFTLSTTGTPTSGSGYQFRATNITIQPNETVRVASVTITTNGYLTFNSTATGSSSATSTNLDIVDEGTSGAYIINNSTSSYYVRFTGNMETGSIPNIVTVNGYNYYIGIVRPGQVVKIPMATSSSVSIETIADTGTYTTSTLSAWDTQIQEIFDTYFN